MSRQNFFIHGKIFNSLDKTLVFTQNFEGELQREDKLISYETTFNMLGNDMYIGQAVFELLSFKVGSENHQRGISSRQKFFGHLR